MRLVTHATRGLGCAALLIMGMARAVSAQPILTVTPNHVDFSPPSIMMGRGSAEIPVELRNTGSQRLNLVDIAIAGAHPGDFKRSSCGWTSLDPGVVCLIYVTFRPTAVGPRQAALAVKTNDPVTPLTVVPLTGNAVPAAPILMVSPPSPSFPAQLPGTSSDPQTITLQNVGTANLHITSITSSRPEFVKTSACDLALVEYTGPGIQCSFEVRFRPNAVGPVSGNLTISSDDPNGPAIVPLSGLGAGPAITVNPSSLNLGTLEVGTGGTPRQVTVTNSGAAPLVIMGVTVEGAQAGDFRAVGAPCTAQPLAACTIGVAFTARGSGTRQAELVLASNATSVRIPVRGFGELVATTPPPALTADDHSFRSGPTPAGCLGNGQKIALGFPVTRAVGPVGPTGILTAPGVAVAGGALSATATLELMVWDAGTTGQHRVTVNNASVGTFPALGPGWQMRTVSVPIGSVLFPSRGAGGMPPAPRTNAVEIEPDSGNVGSCIAVAWARLWFLAVSPVVMVHGNGSDGAFFSRRGFVGALNAAGIPNDSTINLTSPPSGSATIAANAGVLATAVPPIVTSFGVNSVHVVAHSKGGLDARLWLATSAATNPFSVISLTTLSTPHRGSALADLAVAVSATGLLYGLTFADLTAMGILSAGYPDLTTIATAVFNPGLPAGADYRTIGADADINGDGLILSAPTVPVDEYAAARAESAGLTTVFAGSPAGADTIVSAVYGFLRSTRAVVVKVSFVPVPCPPPCPVPLIPVRVMQPVPVPGGAPNDLLVTVPSAMPTSLPPFVAGAFPLVGVAGREHASIANAGVAGVVIPLLLTSDVTRGDLRRTP